MRSGVDNYWHAFLSEQAADTRSSYTAICGHSVPADQIVRGEPEPTLLHRLCLIADGEPTPDNRWHEG
jgi:hypothetical protein